MAENIPSGLVADNPEHARYLTGLANAGLQVGMAVKWGSTTMPRVGIYLALDGSTVNKSDYPQLWGYAQNDSGYTTTSSTVTLPSVAGYIVRAK